MQNHRNDPLSPQSPHSLPINLLHPPPPPPPPQFSVDLFCRLAGGLQSLPSTPASSLNYLSNNFPFIPPPFYSSIQPLSLTTPSKLQHHQRQMENFESPRKRRLVEIDDADAAVNNNNDNNSDCLKRYRTTYSTQQSKILEEVFQGERYISRPQRAELAAQLQLPENTIKVRPWDHSRVSKLH